LRRTGVGLAVAAALLLVHVLPVSAAIEATLSSSQSRPGDLIVLTTENHGIGNLYEGLAAEGPLLIYLARKANIDNEVNRGVLLCGALEWRLLGKLTWVSATGSLSFTVPNVPDGDYYFMFRWTESSRSCSRMGGRYGALVLTVEGSAEVASPVAPAAGQGSRGMPPWAAMVIVVCAVVLVTVALRRRRSLR
jgi:hypothetical protein